jgi:glycosyltransferase involved in cell wall biosynthesis
MAATKGHYPDSQIWTLSNASTPVRGDIANEIRFFAQSTQPILSSLRCSPALEAEIGRAIGEGHIIHNHGLWLFPNLYAAWQLSKQPNSLAKIVHSPRGMLGKEARRISAWKKEPVWWLWQKDALKAAHCLHATAESEYEEIRQAGLKNPTAIIPNGIDIPDMPPVKRESRKLKTILSLGRIHPKKGLDRLVRAWAELEDRFPKWSLRLIGSAELGHDLELIALGKLLKVKRLTIEPAAYGDAKWQAYQAADLFVLPTLNENFGITVAEALACEVPVISTKGAPWQGLEQEKCGWWIDHGVEPLASTLSKAIELDDSIRAEMGRRGKAWMARDFGWPAIGEEMANVYRWLQLGGPVPASVRLK